MGAWVIDGDAVDHSDPGHTCSLTVSGRYLEGEGVEVQVKHPAAMLEPAKARVLRYDAIVGWRWGGSRKRRHLGKR